MLDAGLVGGSLHDQGGQLGCALLGLGPSLQLDSVGASGLPGACFMVRIPGMGKVLASFGVARRGHHVSHVVCELGEDALSVGVEEALFVLDGSGGAGGTSIAEGYSIVSLTAHLGPEGLLCFVPLFFLLLLLDSLQGVVCGLDLLPHFLPPGLQGGPLCGEVLEDVFGLLGPGVLVEEGLSCGSDLFSGRLVVEVASVPPDVLQVLDDGIGCFVLFGSGPFEEMPCQGGFGWAYPGKDGLGLPQLGHDATGQLLYQVFFVRVEGPEGLEVAGLIVPCQLVGALVEELCDGLGVLMEGGVKLCSYGCIDLVEVHFLDGEDELVRSPGGGFGQRGGYEGEQVGWDLGGQQEMVQVSSHFKAGFLTGGGGALSGVDEDVIDSAGVVLVPQLVAVVGVLSVGAGVEGVEVEGLALLLVLSVHGAVGLQSGSVCGVEGGVPVPTHQELLMGDGPF